MLAPISAALSITVPAAARWDIWLQYCAGDENGPKVRPAGAGDHPQGWWWGHRRQPIFCRASRQTWSVGQERWNKEVVSTFSFTVSLDGVTVSPPRYSVLSGPHAPTTGLGGDPLPADAGPFPLSGRHMLVSIPTHCCITIL